ncbi:MAG TPA: acyl-CoA thioesterase/BAAT N-terminal domain-containing protein [Mycobacteriales bacterium]|nr:acyl-CoA thioesterase/BAAT N-terminal domain-containing protein [Mycobacteriales bacterium]
MVIVGGLRREPGGDRGSGQNAALAGSYSDVEPAGLLWSMNRIGGDPQTSYALADPTRTAAVESVTVSVTNQNHGRQTMEVEYDSNPEADA